MGDHHLARRPPVVAARNRSIRSSVAHLVSIVLLPKALALLVLFELWMVGVVSLASQIGLCARSPSHSVWNTTERLVESYLGRGLRLIPGHKGT